MELIVSYIDKISKYDEDLDKAGIPHKSINDFLSVFEMIDLISNSNSISPALLKTDFEQISFAIHQLKTLSKSVLDQKSKIDRKFKPISKYRSILLNTFDYVSYLLAMKLLILIILFFVSRYSLLLISDKTANFALFEEFLDILINAVKSLLRTSQSVFKPS